MTYCGQYTKPNTIEYVGNSAGIYRYAAGFDNAWSIMVCPNSEGKYNNLPMWKSGTAYNYGELPPRYPVPALLART